MKDMKAIAKRKGLIVQKNSLKGGWSVTMPSGTTAWIRDDRDLIHFIKNY